MNTPRISPAQLRQFGLFAIIELRRVVLPLKGVECEFKAASGIAEVSMTQIFRQENRRPLNCEYLFPLPADAAVYFCEAEINGRRIRAEVRERQEARRLAAEKKAAGHRTALVESERDNLFTLSLGNIQPDDLVLVRLKYFQTLRHLGGQPSLEIPLCPGVRYIPGKPLLRSNQGRGTVDDTDEVPDASRITPVRIDAEHPDAAFIEVTGTLDGKHVDEPDVVSPSHELKIQRTDGDLRVALSGKGDVPDRDFVLRWSERNAEAVQPRAWFREKGGTTYALLEIRAPKAAPVERPPVDYYFLVDRSGSMAGQKWDKAVQALQGCVKALGAADRAMVTFFNTNFQDFAEKPLAVRELLEDQQFTDVVKLGTGGGTEMRPALQHVLEAAAAHSGNRLRNLILITDAQIGNESAILALMAGTPSLPVHCFGIDVALNDSLLLALCRQQGGTFHSLNPNDDFAQAMTALGQTLGQPVLLDLQLSEGWETAEAKIPGLYAGQVHYLSARSAQGGPLELTARSATSEPVTMQFERPAAELDAPSLHWCRSRIGRLMAEGANSGAVALSVESNLICRLTAFIAWDESERVAVATHELAQPAMAMAAAGSRVYARSRGVTLTEQLCQDAPVHGTSKGILAAFRGALHAGHRLASPRPGAPDRAPLIETELKLQLSTLCRQAEVPGWEELIKEIFDWLAEATGAERSKRVESVQQLWSQVTALQLQIAAAKPSRDQVDPAVAEDLKRKIGDLLKSWLKDIRTKERER